MMHPFAASATSNTRTMNTIITITLMTTTCASTARGQANTFLHSPYKRPYVPHQPLPAQGQCTPFSIHPNDDHRCKHSKRTCILDPALTLMTFTCAASATPGTRAINKFVVLIQMTPTSVTRDKGHAYLILDSPE